LEKENEEKRLREKAERKENRRINRITENITTNVISTREFVTDIPKLELADVDDFSISSERIHVIGGIFGLSLIVVEELFKKYNMWENTEENLKSITFCLEEYILNGLKDNQSLEIKYLESARFNFNEIPEERQKEFIEFIYDYRRFVNKSIKILIDKGLISKTSLDLFLTVIVGIYFKDKASIPQVDINPENQEPEYIEMKNKEKEKYLEEVERLEKLKRKIKFRMIKPALLKKRRENMAGFIEVLPNENVKENVIDYDEPPPSEKDKSKLNNSKLSQNADEKKPEDGENAENKAEGDPENKEKGEEEKPEEKSEEKKPEEKPEGESASAEGVEKKAEEKPEGGESTSPEKKPEEKKANEEEEEEDEEEEEKEKEGEAEVKEGEEGEKVEEKKEDIVVKSEYLSEAQIFKNSKMKFEPYVIHKNMHNYALINIAKSFRKLLKKEQNLTVDWSELVNCANEKYEVYYDTVYRQIMDNEIYIKEKIIPITAKPLEVEKEKPTTENPEENPVTGEEEKPSENKSEEKTEE